MATRALKEALELFNQKAEIVKDRSFTKYLQENGTGYELKADKRAGTFEIEQNHPVGEAVEAIVLTVRYFIQGRDGVSFDNLAPMYADPGNPIDQSLRDDFRKHYDDITAFLNRGSRIEGLTNFGLLETMVYGELAHSNPEKEAIVKHWKDTHFFEIAYSEFVMVLGLVVAKAIVFSEINAKVLENLP